MIYNLIGRATVKVWWFWLTRKFVVRTALVAGVGVAATATAVGVVGYLLTRDVPEA